MITRTLLLSIALLAAVGASAMDKPFVNWENHPVHALDTSPSGQMLAVANTADNRIQLFDITSGQPGPIGHVMVGLDPVSVRFRNDDELWVVNHISDSVTVIDIPARRVVRTLSTADEPFDVVFAGNPERAFVSASQANQVQVFNPSNLAAAPLTIDINAEDPRALAVSPDGSTVYAAIFESGNATTILAANSLDENDVPNVALLPSTPYGGVSPAPNNGSSFEPSFNPELPPPPPSGLIVRKDEQGRWMDDNNQDWTNWVSGSQAAASGRVVGWDMPDRDIAVIDANSLSVSYIQRLMNIGMAIDVNPSTAEVTMVGTEARNEIRFEPNVNGIFLEVNIAVVDPSGSSNVIDLNPHLAYSTPTLPQSVRDLSLGDPRGILWQQDGDRAYVAGMGSNTVIAIDSNGDRIESIDPIEVGEGPTSLALNESANRLYVWNHFETSLSVVDTDSMTEVDRILLYSPYPDDIRDGRRHFYDTHETSGLGQASCASCHIDGRMDRLAWDLGAPNGDLKSFNQNCGTNAVFIFCTSFHPMKGPMVTMTLQDIIGNEPFHWRGDRDGIEEFNGAFVGLQGDDAELTAGQMQQFEDFLDTLTFPPNPFRNIDNTLASNVELQGAVSPGGKPGLSPAGTPLPNGNAQTGLNLFTNGSLALVPNTPAQPQQCNSCHSLPTGMAPNSAMFDSNDGTRLGGATLPAGPNGENHLLVLGAGTLTGLTMKVPQLRNLYEKTGFETKVAESNAGFGFLHDGSVDSLAHLGGLAEFDIMNDQELADLTAFMLSFSGSDLPTISNAFPVTLTDTQDTHAAVGQQESLTGSQASSRVNALIAIANAGRIDLVASQSVGMANSSWLYQTASSLFEPDDAGQSVSLSALLSQASTAAPITFSAVPAGLGNRLALDRDGDTLKNGVEIAQGSNPADENSTAFRPYAGLWYDPARSGHGMDLQQAGNTMVATWYTYNEDGTSHWYQASGELVGDSWTGQLYQTEWNPGGDLIIEFVGSMTMDFSDRSTAAFSWQIGDETGTEPFIRFEFSSGFTGQNYTGLWFDSDDVGWGISVDSLVDARAMLIFFYDADNQPRWVIGSGANATGTQYTMQRANGFCPWCDTTEIELIDSGTLTMDFDNFRNPMVNVNVDYEPVAGSAFVRQTRLIPLTDQRVDPESF